MVFSSVGRKYGRNGLAGICIGCVVCTEEYDCRLYSHPKATLTHCDRVRFLLREIIPKAPSGEEESSLDSACNKVSAVNSPSKGRPTSSRTAVVSPS